MVAVRARPRVADRDAIPHECWVRLPSLRSGAIMKIGLAGDWHGDTAWAAAALRDLHGRGVRVVMHLGDFGIWPGERGAAYLHAVTDTARSMDMTLYITPGNHEDHDRIDATSLQARDELGALAWLTDRIAVFPRGHRFTLAGRSFVSLGGAPSIDRDFRTPGVNWWPQEVIDPLTAAAVAAAGPSDVMLSHDCPDLPHVVAPVRAILTGPSWWPQRALAYAGQGRASLTTAFLGVQPQVLIHGHYHVYGRASVSLPEGRRARIVALAAERAEGNIAVLNTDTLSIRRTQ